jgi:hypothetical protein
VIHKDKAVGLAIYWNRGTAEEKGHNRGVGAQQRRRGTTVEQMSRSTAA